MTPRPIYDHFLVVQTQEIIDAENDRINKELERIKIAQKSKTDNPRIITSLKDQKIEDDESPYLEHKVEFPVHTVAAVGKDCEELKPGDKVIVRVNTRPEMTVYGGKLYLSFAERSVSLILDK